MLILSSCKSKQKTKENSNTKFYYDEVRGVYALEKFDEDGIQKDTAFLYKDSLKDRLIELNTIIRMKNYPTINQIIHYNDDRTVDISNSYYYTIEWLKEDSLRFKIYSQFNDTIYLEIGELDSNYKNLGLVDSFSFVGTILTIKNKPFYKKGRIGVWEEEEIDSFTGKELFVPEKYLNK